MRIPTIICDVCKKQVEYAQVQQNYMTDAWDFIVRCHGDTDRCSLSVNAIRKADSVVSARAFTTRKIDER